VFIQTIFRARNGNGTSHDFRLDFRSDEKDQCFSSAEGVSEQFLRFRPPIIPRKTKKTWKKRKRSSFFVSDKIQPYPLG
jgi:coproporphyrinogen III oxidase